MLVEWRKLDHVIVIAAVSQWLAAQRCCVHKTCFCKNRKDTKVVCPTTWTCDICASDTGTYYDYY